MIKSRNNISSIFITIICLVAIGVKPMNIFVASLSIHAAESSKPISDCDADERDSLQDLDSEKDDVQDVAEYFSMQITISENEDHFFLLHSESLLEYHQEFPTPPPKG